MPNPNSVRWDPEYRAGFNLAVSGIGGFAAKESFRLALGKQTDGIVDALLYIVGLNFTAIAATSAILTFASCREAVESRVNQYLNQYHPEND